jgi:hypothetical protein
MSHSIRKRHWLRDAGLFFAMTASMFAAMLAPLQAQTSPAKRVLEKPYKIIPLTIAPAPADASFTSFRQEVGRVAKDRVYAELERLVVAQGFFWAGDFGRGFDPKKTSAENFAAAIRLERDEAIGWNNLAAFAAFPDATPMASRPGVICAPSRPLFDEVEFDRINTAAISPAGWVYPRTANVAMRSAPRPASAVIETLGLHLVRLLGYEASETNFDTARAAWARVAAPSGKTGFVAPGALMPLQTDQLCYRKDLMGRWLIVGYVTASE